MKRIISYFILFGAAAVCFASSYKEELWQKYINASQKEATIPANVDVDDWIKEIRKKTFSLKFFTGTNAFYYILDVGENSMSGSCPANSKNQIENCFLDYMTPFAKDKIVPVELRQLSNSNSNPLNSIYFKSQFAYAKNLLEIKTFYAENQGKEDEAYVYISALNKEEKQ
ncbi:MAG: hypothetical protein IKO42_06060 [Opitutales bacterium]|nr:hypothetical protein [Opitutales bacterium]